MPHQHKVSGLMHAGTLLLAHDISPVAFLRKLDIAPSLLLDPDGWIDRRLSFRLGAELSRAINDRFAGLHVAELLNLEHYGYWGTGVLASRTLGDAVQFAIREIGRIDNGGAHLAFNLAGATAHWSICFADCMSEQPIQHLEANLKILRKVLDLAIEPVAAVVRLPYPRPSRTEELEHLLGPSLVFDAGRAELVFARDALSLPLQSRRTAIPASLSVPGHRPSPTTPQETSGAVMRLLRETIELERPTALAISAALGINLRTMQRQLAVWGLSFEELLDDYRHRRALSLLNDGQHSITEIAFRLGYSDSAHFTRAVRRWTGFSPRQLLARRPSVDPAAVAAG